MGSKELPYGNFTLSNNINIVIKAARPAVTNVLITPELEVRKLVAGDLATRQHVPGKRRGWTQFGSEHLKRRDNKSLFTAS